MISRAINFFDEVFSSHLSIINNIKFTHREIDIIACIINSRKTSKIASLLDISPKTVTTHISNIMLKLGCNSRESIIDFVEHSDKQHILRDYYESLIIESNFVDFLKEISKKNLHSVHDKMLLCWVNPNLKELLIHYLEKHFLFAKINCVIKEYKNSPPIDVKRDKNQSSIMLIDKDLKDNISSSFNDYIIADISNVNNYYECFFTILEKICPDINLDSIKNNDFYLSEQILYKEDNFKKAKQIIYYFLKDNKKQSLSIFFVSILIISGCFLIFNYRTYLFKNFSKNNNQYNYKNRNNLIQTDLLIPHDALFLNRSNIIKSMQDKLSVQEGIRTLFLVGIGGAGKTTLARQYARMQNTKNILEINAETKKSLNSSFDKLAYTLSTSETDKVILKGLQSIKNLEERREKILLFVKERIKHRSNWLLIYDNVEKFSDIIDCFPNNTGTWGSGDVILTTRNSNVLSSYHDHHSIHVGELSSEEKLNLFTKILGNPVNQKISSSQIESAKKFLEKIPPYPLDISIAAYYINATGVSYEGYLENLTQYNNDQFMVTQSKILNEVSEYTKTRYGIINSSVQNLINVHKDFIELLLLVSLLDSQNIPRDLLDKCKKSIIVDSFIFYLNKFSLLQNETSSSFREINISFHRSIQPIIFARLMQILPDDKKFLLIQKNIEYIENYLDYLLDKDDFLGIRIMLSHCNIFLSHADVFTDKQKMLIEGILGEMYYYINDYHNAKIKIESYFNFKCEKNKNKDAKLLLFLGNTYKNLGEYKKAQALLERVINIYTTSLSGNYKDLLYAMTDLGNVYRILGDYKKAKNLLEKGLMIQEKYLPNDHNTSVHIFTHLGSLYRILGQHAKAIEKFEKSISIYKAYLPENHNGIPWTLMQLASVYRITGDYEKALPLLQKALLLYKKFFPDDHNDAARTLMHTANIYRKLGNYSKARELLLESMQIYKKYFPENYVETLWPLAHLGIVNRELGNYNEAEVLLQKALIITRNNFPEDHVESSWILAHLGITYFMQGNFRKAEEMLNKSFNNYKETLSNNHVGVYWVLMYLGKLQQRKGNYRRAETLIKRSLEGYINLFGEKNQRSYWAAGNLGNIYLLLGEYTKAKQLLENCVAYYKTKANKENLKLAWLLVRLGLVYRALGDHKNSEILLKEGLSIYQKVSPNNHLEINYILKNLRELSFPIEQIEK